MQNKGGYLYTLNTKGFSPGNYSLVFSVNGDPVNHVAPFRVK
ncbi:MAG: hypothetical protein WBX15_15205 [Thermoanaerobaculia bacterium]